MADQQQDREQPDAPDRWSRLIAERDLYRKALEQYETPEEIAARLTSSTVASTETERKGTR